MKKIIFSLLAIVSVAAVVGVGSYALWSDTETSNDNIIAAAGSLDLLIDGEDWDGTAEIVVDDTFPGDTGSVSGTVENAGTIDGRTLEFTVSGVADIENDLIDPEAEANDGSSVTGELCAYVDVQIDYAGSTVYGPGPISNVGTQTLAGGLAAGEWHSYTISYEVDSEAGNDIMTDICQFDMQFILTQ